MNANANNSGGEFIRHLEASGWAPVPRRLMDDVNLSIEARGALAWLLTRPDGHRLFVRYAQQRLGISQARWQRIRRELEVAGYLAVDKGRDEAGVYRWHYHVFDHPKHEKPVSIGVSSIGQKPTDGLSTGGKPADKEKHPKEIHPKEINNKNKTTHPAGAITQAAPALVASESFNKSKSKNITPPLPAAVEAKASPKASPKTKSNQKNNPAGDELADFKGFKEKLHELAEFNGWLDGLPDRDKNKYRFHTHIYPSLFDIYLGAGLEGVADACEQAAANGYRSLAFCNGGEVGGVK